MGPKGRILLVALFFCAFAAFGCDSRGGGTRVTPTPVIRESQGGWTEETHTGGPECMNPCTPTPTPVPTATPVPGQ